jgi:hypothetical protein
MNQLVPYRFKTAGTASSEMMVCAMVRSLAF